MTSSSWTFLSNHAHVVVCMARDPDARLRDIAEQVGLTERAVHRIVTELEEAAVIRRSRDGRRNHYEIDTEVPFRHPLEGGCTVGALLSMVFGHDAAFRTAMNADSEPTTTEGDSAP